jgi:cytochrome c oxidase subunit II
MAPKRTIVVALGAFALVSVGCVRRAGTAQGQRIFDLYGFFAILAAIIFVVTAGLIGWSILRYRAKRSDDELPPQFHTNVRLELLWFAIPTLIVIVLFVSSVLTLNEVDEKSPDPAVTLEVEAFQWGWRFTYKGADVSISGTSSEIPEIFLPVDQTIAFLLTSDDVQHAFYVPRFLMKRDVIPGRENRFDVVIDEPGDYDGKCAEFCGLLHSEMNFTIHAVPDSEFQEWLRNQGD